MAGIGNILNPIPSIDFSTKQFGVVVAQWHSEITDVLFEGALSTLIDFGVKKKNVFRKDVPGSYELVLGADYMARENNIVAVLCIGCVIRGETPHFDYLCQAVAHGLTQVSLTNRKPVSFGVLTVMNSKQAWQRAGGSLGNKGEEVALAAIKMLAF